MSKFSVKKPMTIFVAVILVVVLGAVSFMKMTPDLMPNIDMPYVIVITTYPGATPEEVEETISKPMEKSLSTLENIETVQSISNANYSMVVLEFNKKVNMDTVSVDILQNVNMISYSWDDTVGSPTIMKINPSMIPVNVAAVSMEGSTQEGLSRFVEDELMNRLEGTAGVAGIDSSGMLKSDISVNISQDKIDKINNKILASVNSELAAASSELQSGRKQVAKAQAELDQKKEEFTSGKDETYDQLSETAASLDAAQAQASAFATQINILEGTKQALEAQLASGLLDETQTQQMKSQLADVNSQLAVLNKSSKEAEGTVEQLKKAYRQAERGSYTAIEKFQSAGSQLDSAQNAIDSSKSQLDSALSQLNSSRDAALAKADIGEALTVDTVSQLLSAQNFSMPAGYVALGETKYLVSVGDKINSLKEIKNMVLFDTGVDSVGTVCVGDVADVFRSDNGDSIYAKINGNDGVLLSFSKQSNYATADVCDNIADKFAELEAEYNGLKFTSMMDQGEYISLIIRSIMQSLLLGAVFAVLILLLFLRHIKSTLITVFSIPVSIIFAIVLMYFSGISLNMISLSGLAVAVGMLVDNSIVVIENTLRLRREGVPPAKAAIAGAGQVGGAITASTITTVCVFVPIIFTDGITRDLFSDMALTIGYSLFASLIVAMTLVPAMSANLLAGPVPEEKAGFKGFLRRYTGVLKWSLKHRVLVLICALLLLVFSVAAVVVKGFTFVPDMTSPQMQVNIQMPEGTELEETIAAADEVMDRVLEIDEVQDAGALLSNGSSFGMSFTDDETPTSVMMYVLLDENMKRTSQEVADEINSKCADIDGEVEALGGSSMMTSYMDSMGGSGVSVNVFCDDTDKLQQAAADIADIISDTEGIVNVENGIEDADPEIHFTVDKKKAMKYNLTVAQVYQEIAKALSDEKTATSVKWQGDDYDVIVEGADASELTPKFIKNYKFKVQDSDGNEKTVKLKDIAEVEDKTTMHSINRMNQETYLTVKGEIDENHNVTLTTDEVMKNIDEKYDCPEDVTYESSGLSETIYDAMKDLVLMMLLGIIMIYLVMVAQFQSLKSPFIIMFTIPLAFTGGLLALLVTGKEISIIAMIGFVMLAGIIVNNGIVLVDYINQLRAKGTAKREAIIEAGRTRMRPVLMTSLTTVLGLSVMAAGKTAGTDMMQPVALVCIGGLIYATALTLIVVPVLYDLFNGEKYKARKEEDLDISGI